MPDAPLSDAESAWLASLPEHHRHEAEWTLRATAAAFGMKIARRNVAAQQLERAA
jgi:hypothetical protein